MGTDAEMKGEEMPVALYHQIMRHCGYRVILRLGSTCMNAYTASCSDRLWKEKYFARWGSIGKSPCDGLLGQGLAPRLLEAPTGGMVLISALGLVLEGGRTEGIEDGQWRSAYVERHCNSCICGEPKRNMHDRFCDRCDEEDSRFFRVYEC
ncbi:hypothetical protein NDN08_001578 [Rhodosorus marinus]|uniref:F-box domain-containing protein n=1 Tax=Rhodosorus marinus TaxID=101924 RepID=A0AAV8UVE4_9RHOD|nr:hypothetical protein NDN08_001578 [Rhodosorus marinus]